MQFVGPFSLALIRIRPNEAVSNGSACITEFFSSIFKIRIVFSAGRGGAVGAKFRMSLALPVGAVMNCADNTGKLHHSYIRTFVLLHAEKLRTF
jgi:hypothetical protein